MTYIVFPDHIISKKIAYIEMNVSVFEHLKLKTKLKYVNKFSLENLPHPNTIPPFTDLLTDFSLFFFLLNVVQ